MYDLQSKEMLREQLTENEDAGDDELETEELPENASNVTTICVD